MFRRVLKDGARQDGGVTANVVWYAVKRYAKRAGVRNLAPQIFVAAARASATNVVANSNRPNFYSATPLCKQRNGTSEANRSFQMR